jgi:hypothetical protein
LGPGDGRLVTDHVYDVSRLGCVRA